MLIILLLLLLWWLGLALIRVEIPLLLHRPLLLLLMGTDILVITPLLSGTPHWSVELLLWRGRSSPSVTRGWDALLPLSLWRRRGNTVLLGIAVLLLAALLGDGGRVARDVAAAAAARPSSVGDQRLLTALRADLTDGPAACAGAC